MDYRCFLQKDEVESVGDEGAIRLVDMKAGPDYAGIFFRLIGLGKSCVSSKPKDRPEMVLVLQRLVATAPFSERQTSQGIIIEVVATFKGANEFAHFPNAR